ncbi:MAG: glutamate racemase [Lachnospiraceae bacterium]|nr:glutamate racemase [Lachnospiraceae bacterium]
MPKLDNLDKSMPIGFMDSGVGGISVLKEAVDIMPNEDFVYIGDSANAPYGTKDTMTIKELTYNVVKTLINEHHIKGLVVACNTATSAAVRDLRNLYPNFPLVGIEPAIKPAVLHNHGGEILVMATPMTIAQEKFKNLLKLYENQAVIIPVPCKGLMEFVEAGIVEGPELDKYFKSTLSPYLNEITESIVLGCTHYPFLKKEIISYLQRDDITLYDGSLGTAREIQRRIKEAGLSNDADRKGNITILNTGLNDSEAKIALCHRLLNL